MDKKEIAIIGGGTVSYIRSHFAISAPAYGKTACQLAQICEKEFNDTMKIKIYMTRMGHIPNYLEQYDACRDLETNDDVSLLIDELTTDDLTKIVFFNASMVDFNGKTLNEKSGKNEPRLDSKFSNAIVLTPANKVIKKVREKRKDIFLVGFKQTFGMTEDEQYIAGLNLCKSASCNLVLANDTKTKLNMVITPEEARYHVTKNRIEALTGLVRMAKLRSNLTFTRSTVIAGEPISWNSELVPNALREVVNFCIKEGAYKAFCGSTVGHFACKLSDNEFLTSIRRSNFNDIEKIGLVRIKTDKPDEVLAYGAKPSVGGMSQRVIFKDHSDYDCICHFHCPIKVGSQVPVRSQYEFECGSKNCATNTSEGLKQFGNLSAVYLQEHGPNIVFNSKIDPNEVIDFIKTNFDLTQKTGGFVSIKERLEIKSTLETAKEIL